MGFTTVPEALDRIRRGEMVIVVDGPDRENEGDLTMAAEMVTAEAVNFMIRHGCGLLCMPCDPDRLDELRLGPMVPVGAGTDTAFTVSIDHHSCGTGVAAAERACTIRMVSDPATGAGDFRRPGHVFPLRARPAGVLERPGHTEAAVDLCHLAGLTPCAAICEVLNEDGTVARVPDLERFAGVHGLTLLSIEDLVAYRRRNGHMSIKTAAAAERSGIERPGSG